MENENITGYVTMSDLSQMAGVSERAIYQKIENSNISLKNFRFGVSNKFYYNPKILDVLGYRSSVKTLKNNTLVDEIEMLRFQNSVLTEQVNELKKDKFFLMDLFKTKQNIMESQENINELSDLPF